MVIFITLSNARSVLLFRLCLKTFSSDLFMFLIFLFLFLTEKKYETTFILGHLQTGTVSFRQYKIDPLSTSIAYNNYLILFGVFDFSMHFWMKFVCVLRNLTSTRAFWDWTITKSRISLTWHSYALTFFPKKCALLFELWQ